MSLKIKHKLIVIQNAKYPKDALVKSYNMDEDTFENRNLALASLGCPNLSGVDPDVTSEIFTKAMKETTNVEKMTVFTILVDEDTNKTYILSELEPEDYLRKTLTIKPKEVRAKERELWIKDHAKIELDLRENYQIRAEYENSIKE
jgi:hypothetical protein